MISLDFVRYMLLIISLFSPFFTAVAIMAEQPITLIPVEDKGKWGFINTEGRTLINPKYDEAGPFSEGVARVKQENKHGYVDGTGKIIIPLQYQDARSFSEGLAAVLVGKKWGYINKAGQFVIPPRFYVCDSFSSSLATVLTEQPSLSLPPGYSVGVGARLSVKATKFGYIDRQGKLVVPATLEGEVFGTLTKDGFVPKFITSPDSFSEGFAAVRIKGKYGFIDKNGKTITPATYEATLSFNEGLAGVQIEENKCGFIDQSGKLAIQPQFESIASFSEGLAPVKLKGKWGYIDKNGKTLIPPRFDEALCFSEGLAAVMQDGRWGYVDKTGTLVIPLKFDDGFSFRNGLAKVVQSGKTAYVNNNGKVVFESGGTK